jgi:hypothetical protein
MTGQAASRFLHIEKSWRRQDSAKCNSQSVEQGGPAVEFLLSQRDIWRSFRIAQRPAKRARCECAHQPDCVVSRVRRSKRRVAGRR